MKKTGPTFFFSFRKESSVSSPESFYLYKKKGDAFWRQNNPGARQSRWLWRRAHSAEHFFSDKNSLWVHTIYRTASFPSPISIPFGSNRSPAAAAAAAVRGIYFVRCPPRATESTVRAYHFLESRSVVAVSAPISWVLCVYFPPLAPVASSHSSPVKSAAEYAV